MVRCSVSAEAPTSRGEAARRWVDGRGEMGGGAMPGISLPRARLTFSLTQKGRREAEHVTGTVAAAVDARVGPHTCFTASAPLARWRIVSMLLGTLALMAMGRPLPRHSIRRPPRRERNSAKRRHPTPRAVPQRRWTRRNPSQRLRVDDRSGRRMATVTLTLVGSRRRGGEVTGAGMMIGVLR